MDPGSVAAFSNLTDDVTTLIVVMFAITAAAWVLGQYMKYRAARRMQPDETAALDRMSQIAQRMERRVAALERVLDADLPSWRNTTPEEMKQDDGGRHGHTR